MNIQIYNGIKRAQQQFIKAQEKLAEKRREHEEKQQKAMESIARAQSMQEDPGASSKNLGQPRL